MTDGATTFDSGRFRDVLGHYPTGVALVTGVAPDGELLALIVGTFSSVSLEPPLVSFMPMRTSRTFERLRGCQSLCINILAGAQEHVSRTVATRYENKFDGIDWYPSPSGDPVLRDSVAWLDVRLDQVVEAGDHYIALCRVVEMDVPHPVAPLIFFQGGYGTFVIPTLIARADEELIPAIRRAERARPRLDSLATEIDCQATLFHQAGDRLVAVASAVAPGVGGAGGLGRHLPMIPPIGDILIAERGPEEQGDWLAKAAGCDEELRAQYQERLRFGASNGYLMSFIPSGEPEAYEATETALSHYENGTATPALERQLRAALQGGGIDYHIEAPAAGRRYNVGSLVAPVRVEGRAVGCLRLSHLPQDRDGSEVQSWIDRLASVADAAGE